MKIKGDDLSKRSVKAVYDVKKKVAIATSDAIDRCGEVVDQDGLNVDDYIQNPVLLWAHDHTQPAIGTAENLRMVKIADDKKAWAFEPNFHGQTELSKAMDVLYNGDPNKPNQKPVLNSFSIGYQVLEEDGNVCTSSTLLEISSCNVPANPDARVLAYKSLTSKGIGSDLAKSIVSTKGAVQDELDLEAVWQQKVENIGAVQDIYWAFCDVYFDEGTSVDDFKSLLLEVAGLFTQVANGSYVDPADEDAENSDLEQLSHKVLDKLAQKPKDDNNTAKVEPTASVAPDQKIHSRQALVKVIAKATDQILAGEKSGADRNDQVKMVKIIKRSAEILSKSHKDEINHG